MRRVSYRREIGDRQATAIVVWFRIQRIFRALVLFILGTAILGGGGAYVVALVGPEDGIARRYAEQYHLLPGLEEAKKIADEALRATRKAYERGDVLDLEHAEELIARVRKVLPRDGRMASAQALILCEHADALRRWQKDLEIESAHAASKTEEAQLRELASAKGLQADSMLRSAETAVKEANALAPGSIETVQASAHYRHIAHADDEARKLIALAKTLNESDPWTLVLEASLHRSSEAAEILRRALSMSPDFVEARVKLARALIDANETDLAKKELEAALAKAPVHREGKRLLARIEGASH
jgi:hypothetical protein